MRRPRRFALLIIAMCLGAIALLSCAKRQPRPEQIAQEVRLPPNLKSLFSEGKFTEILASIDIEPNGSVLNNQQLEQMAVLLGQISATSSSLEMEEPKISTKSDLFVSLNGKFVDSMAWHLISVRARAGESIELTPVAAYVQQYCEYSHKK
jgi:hypothetical protein